MVRSISLMLMMVVSLVSFGQKKKRLTPVEYVSKTRILAGKRNVYYPLSEKKATVLNLEGAEVVKLFCRVRMEKNKSLKTITIRYNYDNEDYMHFKTLSFNHKSSKAIYEDKMLETYPSELKSFEITIPKGKKRLKVFLKTEDKIEADVKFRKIGNKGSKQLKPVESASKPLAVLIGSKKRYYTLSKKEGTTIVTNKPGKLYVYARVKTNKSKKIAVKYVRDNKLVKTLKRDSLKSIRNVVYTSKLKNDKLSSLQKFAIKVPNGKHTYSFFESGKYSSTEVYFEFLEEKPKKWSDIKVPNQEVIKIQSTKSKVPRGYYRVDKKNPIEVTLEGPMQVRIASRVEFKYFMHANAQVMLSVKENGKQIKAYKFSSNRSKKMEYTTDKEHIPGTLNKIYIDVPEGKHTYSFCVENEDKVVLIRLSKPKENTAGNK